MPHLEHDAKLLSSKAKLSRGRLALYGGLTALVGIVVVVVIFAATGSLAIEAESGTLGGAAKVVTVTGASGGKAVQFGSGATPTPTPTAAPTSTPTAGFPNASNTGYEHTGVTLHSCSGTISAAGTYDSCTFSGGVTINANNVTITRSLINGQVKAGDGTQTGLVINDTTINCNCGSTASTTPPAIAFSNFHLARDNIYNAGHGVQINDNAVVEDSYIHDLCCDNAAHKDGVISNGGGNATINHNTVECMVNYCSAAIGLFGDFGPISHWNITNNLLNTAGGYCLYGGDSTSAKPYPTATYMVITGNHFGKKGYAKCGQYGPVAYFDNNTGNSWSGNVWDDTGAVINP